MKGTTRAFTVLIHLWSTVHLLLVVSLWRHPGWAVSMLYLLPPLLARIVVTVCGRPSGTFAVDSRPFLTWWALASLQSIFLRLPFLEELLRMFPLVYSNWLRLWGSKIGTMVYWAPGTCIFDRSYLEVGDHVVFGVGARISPHVVSRGQLIVATVKIGRQAQVGGYSLLGPGSEIAAGEFPPAALEMRPFSRFIEGKLWPHPKTSS